MRRVLWGGVSPSTPPSASTRASACSVRSSRSRAACTRSSKSSGMARRPRPHRRHRGPGCHLQRPHIGGLHGPCQVLWSGPGRGGVGPPLDIMGRALPRRGESLGAIRHRLQRHRGSLPLLRRGRRLGPVHAGGPCLRPPGWRVHGQETMAVPTRGPSRGAGGMAVSAHGPRRPGGLRRCSGVSARRVGRGTGSVTFRKPVNDSLANWPVWW